MIWIVGIALALIWFISKFVFHKGGFVHILLLCAIAVLVIQWVATRRARGV